MSRQKLSFDVVQQTINDGGDALVSDEYVNSRTPLDILCTRCQKRYQMTYSRYRVGQRCRYCSYKRHTIEHVREMIKQGGDTCLSIEYTNCQTPIDILCSQCQEQYQMSYSNYQAGSRCRHCSYKSRHTIEYVREKIEEGGDTLITTEYFNARTPLTLLCSQCKQKYQTTYDYYQRGRRCGHCFGTKRHTIEHVREVISKDSNKLLSDTYTNSKTHLDIQCGKCGNVYHTNLNNYRWGTIRCKNCVNQKLAAERRFSFEYIRSYIDERGDILLSNDYVNCMIKLKVKCGQCYHTYNITFQHYSRGVRCGRCISSKGESEVERCLLEKGIHFEAQKRIPECCHIRPLPFDFYCKLEIDEKGPVRFIAPFLIEYNGIQHYKPVDKFGGQKSFDTLTRNDKIKEKYCKDNDIPFLVISYKDYKRVNTILDDFIESILDDLPTQ